MDSFDTAIHIVKVVGWLLAIGLAAVLVFLLLFGLWAALTETRTSPTPPRPPQPPRRAYDPDGAVWRSHPFDRLLTLGLTEMELKGISTQDARTILEELERRAEQGLASYKQLKSIRKYVPDCPEDITFSQASAALDYIYRGGIVDPLKLRRLIHGE